MSHVVRQETHQVSIGLNLDLNATTIGKLKEYIYTLDMNNFPDEAVVTYAYAGAGNSKVIATMDLK